jgi:hypothetical protein
MLDEGDLLEAADRAVAVGFGHLPEVMGRSARAWLFAGGAAATPSRADRR